MLYDCIGLYCAARLLTFRAFGWRWRVSTGQAKMKVGAALLEPPRPYTRAQLHAEINPDGSPRWPTAEGSARQTAHFVDARAPTARGEAPEPRAGLRGGHMPGSFNVPFGEVLKDGRLKSPDDIAAVFKHAGVDLDNPVVTSCGSGVTAAILTFAIEALGKPPGRVYDGSWSEWGARRHIGRERLTGAAYRFFAFLRGFANPSCSVR